MYERATALKPSVFVTRELMPLSHRVASVLLARSSVASPHRYKRFDR